MSTSGFLDDALAWSDRWYDVDASLLWNPAGSYDELATPRTLHLVPQSAWHAAGLLARDDGDDRDRAVATLDRLCGLQYDEPATAWHGTFARFAEWPAPSEGAVEWVDYDPNWRQFLGTTFAVVLARFEHRLPAATADRLRVAIARAIVGEPPDRVPPTYSNIALMRAWLEVEHAVDPDRRTVAVDYARSVVAAYDEHGAFEEYNSPTYYGLDLYALGLWARHSSSPVLAEEGARLEASLWRDIARWWHAGLGNLCGPWSRSYGMDMGAYAALLGLWIGPNAYPDLTGPFEHAHDTTFAPMIGLVGRVVPADVNDSLDRFGAEHTVVQAVTATRTATAWLADRVMVGGEAGNRFPARGQYHPATVHWPGGWLRIRHEAAVDAVAEPGRLTATARWRGASTVLLGGTLDPAVPIAVATDGRRLTLGAPKQRIDGATSVVVEVG